MPKEEIFVEEFSHPYGIWQFLALYITEVKPVQPEKASFPMVVTALPMVTEVKPLQPEKALSPMEMTEAGIVKVVNLLHFANDLLRIVITVPGISNAAISNGA